MHGSQEAVTVGGWFEGGGGGGAAVVNDIVVSVQGLSPAEFTALILSRYSVPESRPRIWPVNFPRSSLPLVRLDRSAS